MNAKASKEKGKVKGQRRGKHKKEEPILDYNGHRKAVLENERSRKIKTAVRRACEQLGADAMPILVESLGTYEETRTKIKAIMDLGVDDELFDELSLMLREGKWIVKSNVSDLFGEMGEERCIGPLVDAVKDCEEGDRRTRRDLLESLSMMGDIAVPALMELANNERGQSMDDVLCTLIEMRASEATHLLLNTLFGGFNRPHEDFVGRLMDEKKDLGWLKAGEDQLFRKYREDSREEMMKIAVVLLGRVARERALSAFLEDTVHSDADVQKAAIYGIRELERSSQDGDSAGYTLDAMRDLILEVASEDHEKAMRAIRGLGLFVRETITAHEGFRFSPVNEVVVKFLSSLMGEVSDVSRAITCASAAALFDITRDEIRK